MIGSDVKLDTYEGDQGNKFATSNVIMRAFAKKVKAWNLNEIKKTSPETQYILHKTLTRC